MKKVLFLAAHCDDIELGCGATVHKYSRQDWSCRALVLAWGTKDGNCLRDAARDALHSLGVCEVQFGDFVPTTFQCHRQRIWEALKEQDETYRPDVVFTTHPDEHQDHATLYAETLRNFRRASVFSYRPSTRNCPDYTPSYYVMVSKENVDAKIASLRHYKIYRKKQYMDPRVVEAQMRIDGVYVEAEFAEAFVVRKLMG